jgi:adenylate kinase
MIILIGIAGSGKGTQGKLLAEKYGFQWISSGEILRTYVEGEQRERMLAGELVDDKEIMRVWGKVLTSMSDKDKCVLDGFPRTIHQAQWLLEKSKKDKFKVTEILHLIASRQAVTDRLMGRGRQDDHSQAIEARFNEYEKSTMPILDWFEKQGVKVVNINAEQSIEDVHQEIIEKLGLV